MERDKQKLGPKGEGSKGPPAKPLGDIAKSIEQKVTILNYEIAILLETITFLVYELVPICEYM